MVEKAFQKDVMPNAQYMALVRSIYDGVKTSTKDGLRVNAGRFFPRKASGPIFVISFNPDNQTVLFGVADFRGSRETSMEYHIADEGVVFKTGYLQEHGRRGDGGTTYFTDLTREQIGQMDDNDFVEPPVVVGIDELTDVAKLIEDPHANAGLFSRLHPFQI